MKYEKLIKQLAVAIIGNTLLGLGIALTSRASFGVDVTVAFSYAMFPKLGVTFGQMTAITNAVLVAIVLFIYPKNLGISTLLVAFGNQYPLDFFDRVLPYSDVLMIIILFLALGIIMTALGAAIIIRSSLGMGIYEAFVFAFSKKFNKKFVLCKYACDSVFLILVILLKGPLGVGSIACYCFTGICIDFFNTKVLKFISFE